MYIIYCGIVAWDQLYVRRVNKAALACPTAKAQQFSLGQTKMIEHEPTSKWNRD